MTTLRAPVVLLALGLTALLTGCGASTGGDAAGSSPQSPGGTSSPASPPASPPTSSGPSSGPSPSTPDSLVPPPTRTTTGRRPPTGPSDNIKPQLVRGRVTVSGSCTYLQTPLHRLVLRGEAVGSLTPGAQVVLLVRPLTIVSDPCGEGVVSVLEVRPLQAMGPA